MDDVDGANDLLLMDLELEQQPTVDPAPVPIATDIIDAILRHLRGD